MLLECLVRKKTVPAHPEEVVRQNVLNHLIKLSYPLSSIAVEVELKSLPHLVYSSKIPTRRADIICFGKGIHPSYPLYPLLLVECKAVPLKKTMINQVTGYNHFLKASYIAIVNQTELCFGWYDLATKNYRFISHLPDYQSCLKNLKFFSLSN